MTTTITDVSGERRLVVEGDNPKNPTSVFLVHRELVMEFDRAEFLSAVAGEFGLVDCLEVLMGFPESDLKAEAA